MYGKAESFQNLNQRKRNWKGDIAHQIAVENDS
jgi:hypothetical protein